MTCHTFLENSFTKNNFGEFTSFPTLTKVQVQHIDPFISDSLKEIWQPPKLA
ncbi:Uncharacterised protein [Chryseobacterium taihuense]|uniref:Uncharacterized protein n=2 Tax=Chryseobacterium taihuense TaxID=1141221 RepID=A0A1G9KV34_9FLAO|nr:hypothetical protein SAMN05216273_10277 [Chryseobacterium taihuense]VFB03975.1 Uncharacterised protein [Chryseobacterium taihuense]